MPRCIAEMRILLVIDGMHPRSGGPPAVIAGSARALAARGHRVTVLSTVIPGDEEVVRQTWAAMLAAGVNLRFCAPEGLRGMAGVSPQRDVIKAAVGEADVVHLHGVWNPVLVVAGRAARRLGRPYFISVHGVFDRRAMERVRRKWIKKRAAMWLFGLRGILDNAEAVVFGSEAEAQMSWLPSASMRIAFVPNGVAADVGLEDPTATELETLYAEAPAARNWRRIILCRSRIHEEKGIDMLVDAFHHVATDFPDTGLLIAGMRQDTEYEARLEEAIARGGVADRIAMTTRLTGPTSHFLYRAATIFAMPSIAEGFSMALVEGLANARPMLITRYCHMGIVGDVGAGVVVDPEPGAIVYGLRALLSRNDDALAAMGAAARRLFEERYTWDRVAEQLDILYSAAGAESG